MECLKTGGYAFLIPHQLIVYGDWFAADTTLLGRVCEIKPLDEFPLHISVHFLIRDWSHWFDQNKTSMERNSTIVTSQYRYLSYEGKALRSLIEE